MTSPFLAHDIEAEEGREAAAYPDPLSPLGKAVARAGLPMRAYRRLANWAKLDPHPWTCGVGCTGMAINVTTVWTDAEIDAALQARIAGFKAQLDKAFPWWRQLSDLRQDVLVQMAFQMGVDGVKGFPHALMAMRCGAYREAKAHMLDSDWARTQTPARAKRLAEQMATGGRAR